MISWPPRRFHIRIPFHTTMAGLYAFRYHMDMGLGSVRASPGCLSALGFSHSKSILYGGSVWAGRALNS